MFFFFFFEDDILHLIESLLNESETLERGSFSEDYGYDYFLPNGCKELALPPRTALQIKKRLAPGIVSIAIRDAIKLVSRKNDVEMCVVIYYESDDASLRFILPDVLEKKFRVISGPELLIQHGSTETISNNDWKEERSLRLEKAGAAIHYAPNTLFIGAGLSCGLGLPNWDSLLSMLASKLHTSIPIKSILTDSRGDNLVAARYLTNAANKQDNDIVAELRTILYPDYRPARSIFMDSVIKLIDNVGFEEIITYNYDNYLEEALEKRGIGVTSIDRENRRIKNYLPVLHVHGIVHPDDKSFDKNVVLAEEQYHELYKDSFHWANIAQLYALTHTTCLFLGLSMSDPSLRRLLDIASKQGSGNVEHYAFLLRDEYQNHRAAEEIFGQMGVGIIWCDGREDVAVQVLRLAESRN